MSEEKEHNELGETSPIQMIEEGGDAIDEKKLLRKLDWYLVPGLTILFLLSFLDRSNGNPSLSSPCLPFISPFFQLEMLVSRVSPQTHT